ncbi:MAG: hypothetical protein H6851_02195 [Geminicoccaceae bacterium]|nr:hypothetical protein [Geminicoccaceae bacterium]
MMSATHEALREHVEVKSSSNRSFGLTVGGILIVLGLIRAAFSDHGLDVWSILILAIGAALLAAALVAPDSLAVANRAWTKLGLLMARIINPIVLFAIFAITIVPIGLFMRMTGKRPLALSPDPEATTYWIDRGRSESSMAESLRNQF